MAERGGGGTTKVPAGGSGGSSATPVSSSSRKLAIMGQLGVESWSDGQAPLKHGSEKLSSSTQSSMQQGRAWNTNHLSYRVGSDTVAALSAGGLVAPIIAVIDRGIMENASGRNTLSGSIRASLWQLATRPHRFLLSKPFALVFALYSGTYLTANLTDTVSSTITNSSPSTTTAGATKFAATSSANLALCLYKDSKFTRMFGQVSTCHPAPVVGLPTYALFTLRDSLTIFASFNLPALLAPSIPSLPLSRLLGEGTERTLSSMAVAQFVAPAGMQLLSTPLHLLGLDLYNRPRGGTDNITWRDRLHKVGREYVKSTTARMARIVPAFGVGGVVNRSVRQRCMGSIEELD